MLYQKFTGVYRILQLLQTFKIDVTKEYILYLMLYEFNKGNNATVVVRNISEAYGQIIYYCKPVSKMV